MTRKPKFKPVITRVKLNPEQAVLTCNCYSGGMRMFQATYFGDTYSGVTCQYSSRSQAKHNMPVCNPTAYYYDTGNMLNTTATS